MELSEATYTMKDERVINDWVKQIMVLSEIARPEPQPAYTAFWAGFVKRKDVWQWRQRQIEITNSKGKRWTAKKHPTVQSRMNEKQLRANDLTQQKGASNWLTTLPLQNENPYLSRRDFLCDCYEIPMINEVSTSYMCMQQIVYKIPCAIVSKRWNSSINDATSSWCYDWWSMLWCEN